MTRKICGSYLCNNSTKSYDSSDCLITRFARRMYALCYAVARVEVNVGYLLQLVGAPLLVIGLFSIVGGAAWFFLDEGGASKLLALAWAGPGLLATLAGVLFLRAGRRKLREAGDLGAAPLRRRGR